MSTVAQEYPKNLQKKLEDVAAVRDSIEVQVAAMEKEAVELAETGDAEMGEDGAPKARSPAEIVASSKMTPEFEEQLKEKV